MNTLSQFGSYCANQLIPEDAVFLKELLILNARVSSQKGLKAIPSSVIVTRLYTGPVTIPVALANSGLYVIQAVLDVTNKGLRLQFKAAIADFNKDISSAIKLATFTVLSVAYAALGLLFGSYIFTKFVPTKEYKNPIEHIREKKNEKIYILSNRLVETDQKIREKDGEIRKKEILMQQLENTLAHAKQAYEMTLKVKDEEIASLQPQQANLNRDHENILKSKEDAIADLQRQLNTAAQELEIARKAKEEHKRNSAEFENDVKKQLALLTYMNENSESIIKNKLTIIADLQLQLDEAKAEQENTINAKQATIADLERLLDEAKAKKESLEEALKMADYGEDLLVQTAKELLATKAKHEEEIQQLVNQKSGEIAALKHELEELINKHAQDLKRKDEMINKLNQQIDDVLNSNPILNEPISKETDAKGKLSETQKNFLEGSKKMLEKGQDLEKQLKEVEEQLKEKKALLASSNRKLEEVVIENQNLQGSVKKKRSNNPIKVFGNKEGKNRKKKNKLKEQNLDDKTIIISDPLGANKKEEKTS